MEVQTFDDVFDALAKTPADAANMKARADLLGLLVDRVKSWDMTQEAAASKLGITRSRLNDLLGGKLGKFSLDALVNLAAAAGFETTNSIGLAQWLLSTAAHSRRPRHGHLGNEA
jgi:predicted XRE-type DNA-binding protein